MEKVIVKAKHLQAIADAIRECNGRQVLYKPREMAPAIDELPELVHNTHAYKVTINQTPHQTITVHKYLDDKELVYTGSFNVGEVFYKITASIEADEGYQAGQLNHTGVIVVDRDIVIEATPATEV